MLISRWNGIKPDRRAKISLNDLNEDAMEPCGRLNGTALRECHYPALIADGFESQPIHYNYYFLKRAVAFKELRDYC